MSSSRTPNANDDPIYIPIRKQSSYLVAYRVPQRTAKPTESRSGQSGRIQFQNLCGVFVAVLLFAGCATEGRVPLNSGDVATFSVPFAYEDSLGVGAGKVEGSLELSTGSEAIMVSRAIVLALQEFQNSIVEPDLGAGEALPQKRRWVSDRAPVPPPRIRDHNASYPEMKLPERYYGLQYVGEYAVVHQELVFRVSAQLYERGAATDWREYHGPYSGKFFVDALSKLIEDKLRDLTKRRTR